MSKKYLIPFGFVILLVLSGQSSAQKLNLPYRDVGACPFECCTYQQWTATKETVLLRNLSDGSPVLFRVKKGEKVEGVTGIVITTKAGIGKAAQNTNLEYYDKKKNEMRNVSIKKGESFLILTYLGEGIYKVWYKGRMLQGSLDYPHLKKISDPISVWWVKIKNRKGQIGWTKMTRNFDNVDSCG
jgi:hypothetical protein